MRHIFIIESSKQKKYNRLLIKLHNEFLYVWWGCSLDMPKGLFQIYNSINTAKKEVLSLLENYPEFLNDQDTNKTYYED